VDVKRWLIPAVLIPMVIAGACRGGSQRSSTVGNQNSNNESWVEGKALAPFDGAEEDPAIGQPAPSVSGLDLLTDESVLVAPSGRPLVVAALTEWLLANKLPTTVDLIAVSTFEAPERGNHPPARWLSDEGWRHPVISDTPSMTVAEAFGATSVPYFVFIEADGTVAFRMSGNLGPDQLSSAMKRLTGTSI
jgi:hypothetical protein